MCPPIFLQEQNQLLLGGIGTHLEGVVYEIPLNPRSVGLSAD